FRSSLKPYDVEIVFVNDGSHDATESIISALAVADPLVVPISFTRNFGKEPALFAGLDYATGDVVIPIDVDLQDPIEVIPHLINKWQAGAEMVLAKRIDRS
ncbi:glycosyltransferase, partial [Salmonella enterica]|uniref:glycosyltransferase n=1 Tax=Salmonella enterica TaxID=28901 RepID=UPI0011312F80